MDKEELSGMMLETVPMLMRLIRSEMRELAAADMTVQQFRILAQLYRGVATNGQVAENLGVSLPAATRLIDTLVRKSLVERRQTTHDRRKVDLTLSRRGRSQFERIRQQVRAKFAERLAITSSEEREKMYSGLEVMRKVFMS